MVGEKYNNKKIAIMGGTFDPVHLGHMSFARDVLEQTDAEEVVFMPAKLQPFKLDVKMSSFQDRYNMLQLACEEMNKSFAKSAGDNTTESEFVAVAKDVACSKIIKTVSVSSLENELDGASYTYRTLEEFRRRYMSADTANDTKTESKSESKTDSISESQSEPKINLINETKSESEINLINETKSESEINLINETKNESEINLINETKSESKTNLIHETKSESEIDSNSESNNMSISDSVEQSTSGFNNQSAKLYFITGADTFTNLDTWKEAEKLLTENAFIVGVRPGYPDTEIYKKKTEYEEKYGTEVRVIMNTPVDMSATEIRNKVAEYAVEAANLAGSDSADNDINASETILQGILKSMVTEKVAEYISRHGLYRE